jgi:hypothetical protein
MRRARAAYCSVDSVSAASAAPGDTHATMHVCESPPSESCTAWEGGLERTQDLKTRTAYAAGLQHPRCRSPEVFIWSEVRRDEMWCARLQQARDLGLGHVVALPRRQRRDHVAQRQQPLVDADRLLQPANTHESATAPAAQMPVHRVLPACRPATRLWWTAPQASQLSHRVVHCRKVQRSSPMLLRVKQVTPSTP